jgi:hypothetical protein
MVGSVWVWVRSEPDLLVGRFIEIFGTEAIMVKDVIMSGQIASDLVFMHEGHFSHRCGHEQE